MGFLIRPFQIDDAEALAPVYLESAVHHAALEPERYLVPDQDTVIRRYREQRQHPTGARGITLVALDEEGALRGFVDAWIQWPTDLMHKPCRCCYIAEIAVAESFRSQGIGAILMAAIEEWGRKEGAEMALLEYNANNPRAAAFYQHRLGYHPGSAMVLKWL